MIEAACQSCGKIWKVPDATVTYRCMECGGRVGQNVGDSPGPAGVRAPRVHDAEKSAQVREFVKVKKVIGIIRTFYAAGAFVTAAQLFLILLIGAVVLEELDSGIFLAVLTFLGVTLALQIMGAIRVSREPYFWTVFIASTQTLNLTVSILTGSELFFIVVNGVFAACFWLLVQRAARLREIFREHPELLEYTQRRRGAHHQAGMKRIKAGRSGRRKELLVVSGIVLTLIPILIMVLHFATKPPSVADRTGAFAEQWTKGGPDQLSSFFGESSRVRIKSRLKRRLDQRGWGDDRPQLTAPQIEEDGGSATATYSVGGSQLITRWSYVKPEWYMTSIEFPARPASEPIGPTLERFTEAWNAGDVAGMAGFFRPEKQKKRKTKLTRMLNRRGWVGAMPRVRSNRVYRPQTGRAKVNLNTSGGIVETTWEYLHPNWVLVGFKLP